MCLLRNLLSCDVFASVPALSKLHTICLEAVVLTVFYSIKEPMQDWAALFVGKQAAELSHLGQSLVQFNGKSWKCFFFFFYVTGKYLLSKIEIMNIVFNIPDYLTLEDHIIYHVLELVLAKVCMTLPRGIAPWLVAVPGMAALWGFVWVLCFVL